MKHQEEDQDDSDFIPIANTIILEYLLEHCGSVANALLKQLETNYILDDVFIRVRLLVSQFRELPDVLNSTPDEFDKRLNKLMKSLRDLLSDISDEDFGNKIFVLASFDKKPFEAKLDKWEKKLKACPQNNNKQKQAALEGLINNIDKLHACLPQQVRMINILKDCPMIVQQLRKASKVSSNTSTSANSETPESSHRKDDNDTQTQTRQQQSVVTPKKKLKQTVLTPFTPQQKEETTFVEVVTISQSSTISSVKERTAEIGDMDTTCGMSSFEKSTSNVMDYNQFILNRTKKKDDVKYQAMVQVLEETMEDDEASITTENEYESDEPETILEIESSEEERKKRPRRTRKPKKERLNPSVARSIIRESASTPKKPSRFWTELEVKALESGYEEFGNDWERILIEYRDIFHESRNPSALKERFSRALAPKFREKYGHVEL
ncbi:hypothetical protein C9374_004442 [Naegleria lovaniensis]|uniref:Myb-like domain-containing protein n=1 Tax=Naegleria lovaniensis TaxID=51637 RepID=A0AA88KL04_NAELO|nr:uncharacterized protein C9374_004442 [Naegleria lovaniensis]KAG2383105.1 hypothetical protein C9374_004442 [Naegleria lovaniensis]